jgi:hypothetical protein
MNTPIHPPDAQMVPRVASLLLSSELVARVLLHQCVRTLEVVNYDYPERQHTRYRLLGE